MHGRQRLKIFSKRLEYDLLFTRNVTIIRGNSGTGKTTLCEILSEYLREGDNSVYKVQCTCELDVLSGNWSTALLQISAKKNCLLFVDEDANYLKSKEFANSMDGSSNYFVIISRDTLKTITYSYKEVYELASTSVGNTTITTNTPFYKELNLNIKLDELRHLINKHPSDG